MRRIDHPRLRTALRTIQESLDEAWRGLRDEVGTTDDRALADVVLQDPSEFDWRVVDAALQRLRCDSCGSELGAGPLTCARCNSANGFRFAAREVDRPGVPPGNEHAIRVSSAVARTRDRYTPRARCGYELGLPDLLAGAMPSTVEATRMKAAINRLTDDQLEQLIAPTDLQTG